MAAASWSASAPADDLSERSRLQIDGGCADRVGRGDEHRPWVLRARQPVSVGSARCLVPIASGLAISCLLRSIRSLSDCELATVRRVQLLDQVVA